jgi:nucleotide-binding universal stress UspA family protein
MKREYQIDQVRCHSGRLPAAKWDRRVKDGASPTRAPSAVDADLTLRGATEQMGLTLTSPPRYRSILVPVDGSSFGEHALPLALGIACRTGADVRVVHVHLPLESVFQREGLPRNSGLDAWLRLRQQEYLDDLIRRLAKVATVPVRPVFLEGREIVASLCAAARAGVDLVVMATHGRGPLARLWCGSIADVLMRRLSVPLLLVRGSRAPADLTGERLVRHVLVPLDGSEFAEQVLEPAVALGTLTGADHTLLHVAPPATDDSVGSGGGSRCPPGDRRPAEARGYLRRVVDYSGRVGRR